MYLVVIYVSLSFCPAHIIEVGSFVWIHSRRNLKKIEKGRIGYDGNIRLSIDK